MGLLLVSIDLVRNSRFVVTIRIRSSRHVSVNGTLRRYRLEYESAEGM